MQVSQTRHLEILNRHLTGILDLLHDGIYISDSTGKTLMINKPYEKLTGIAAETVMGRNVMDLVREGVFSTIVNPDVVATRDIVTLVQEVNGRKVVLHGHPVFDREGKVELVVTFVRDVTVLSRLKEEVNAQKTLVEYYQRQVSTLDPEDVFLDDGIVAVSEPFLEIIKLVGNIAPTDVTVLILGETGVGKDVVAKRIHQRSSRAAQSFLKVDCSAIPESLVESELFGYAPGAFSGAHSKGKQGYFARANNGTLFLDEVGELSLPMQTKLLRAIHDQEIIRVGSTNVTKINVRIVAATNKDLQDAVDKGSFRSDLFYRLKVAVIKIPPLRERKDDILPLVKVYLQRFNNQYNKKVYLSSRAENILLHYEWPGNVRELENFVHSLVVNTPKPRVSCTDLPPDFSEKSGLNCMRSDFSNYDVGNRPLKDIIGDIERDLINDAISVYGSVTKAAKALQVDRSTLFRKVKSSPKKK